MKKGLFAIYLVVFALSAYAQNLPVKKEIRRLAFGSCNKQFEDQSYWPNIYAQNPDIWVWLGDNIYADNLSPEDRLEQYMLLKNNPYYADFRKLVPIVGVWDDHDYGANDLGANYPLKEESKMVFGQFMDYGETNPIYKRKGIYQHYKFGPKGNKVLLILLDVRTFRGRPYFNNSILGGEQWKWLEKEISYADNKLIIVASPTQVLPMANGERWANYPSDRRKLLNLITKERTKGKKFLLLSGDRHFGEISKMDLSDGKPLYEISASGLTHTNPDFVGPAALRVGAPLLDLHFGMVDILWRNGNPTAKIQLVKTTGESFASVEI